MIINTFSKFMNRYRFKLIYMLMVALMFMSNVSCSSDDDDTKASSSYTTDEIIDLIYGTWEVSGQYKWSVIIDEDDYYNERGEGNYSATIEFTKDYNYKFRAKDEKGNSIDNFFLLGSIGNYHILKKQGKNYIVFGDYESAVQLEIVSLSKNGFKLSGSKDDGIIYISTDDDSTGKFSWYLTMDT